MDRVGWFNFIGALLGFLAGWFTPPPRGPKPPME